MSTDLQQGEIDSHEWGRMGPGIPCIYVPPVLDRAWSFARLTRVERMVLHRVAVGTIAFTEEPEASPVGTCQLDAGALSRSWGLPRSRVARAINSLVRDGVIVRSDSGFAADVDPTAWAGGRISSACLPYVLSGGHLGDDAAETPDPEPGGRDDL